MMFPVSKFTDIVLDKSGGNKKLSQDSFLSEGTYPVIDQGKNFIAGFINDKEYLVKSTDLPVVIFGDHTKAIKYVDFPFVMGADGVKVLKPKPECDTKYLYQYLRYAKIPDAGYSRHYKFLKELNIPLPPLEEQRRIALILDQADGLRQKRQQAIEKLDQLLQATFIDMFGDPNTYQDRFPIKTLKQVCTKITDGEHGTVERLDSGKLYLMARNITKNMTLDISEVSYISEEDHQRIYKRCSPEFGDLMIVCVGATIGKLCLVPEMEEFSLARSVALLKPDNNSVISQYLLHLLASDYIQQKILNSRNTAAQAGLYLGKLSIIEIPVPSIELQEKWSKIAISIEDQKQKLYKQLDIQNQLFSALQQQAFSGNL